MLRLKSKSENWKSVANSHVRYVEENSVQCVSHNSDSQLMRSTENVLAMETCSKLPLNPTESKYVRTSLL